VYSESKESIGNAMITFAVNILFGSWGLLGGLFGNRAKQQSKTTKQNNKEININNNMILCVLRKHAITRYLKSCTPI
jgi:cytochrome oxidase Cu insertion factor (SCO1/SenC/PrrC family)